MPRLGRLATTHFHGDGDERPEHYAWKKDRFRWSPPDTKLGRAMVDVYAVTTLPLYWLAIVTYYAVDVYVDVLASMPWPGRVSARIRDVGERLLDVVHIWPLYDKNSGAESEPVPGETVGWF